MPDVPVPTPPDTPAEDKALVPQETAEIVPPIVHEPADVPERPPTGSQSPAGTPWWLWWVGFLVVFGVDAALVLVLVAQNQNLAVAVGVPGALTVVALGVLRALAGHMGARD